jgi:hypothetical protein
MIIWMIYRVFTKIKDKEIKDIMVNEWIQINFILCDSNIFFELYKV